MANADVNWKLKYQELKMKFMSSVDTAFRLGFEQGSQQAQIQSAQEQAAQQAEAAAQGQPGQEGQPQEGEEQPQEQEQPASAHPGGSELDQHLNELSSMLGKTELTGEDMIGLKKSFSALKASVDLAKSEKAISVIAKNLRLPVTSLAPKHAGKANLPPVASQALSMQEKIVSDMMQEWAKQESSAKTDILSIIKKD